MDSCHALLINSVKPSGTENTRAIAFSSYTYSSPPIYHISDHFLFQPLYSFPKKFKKRNDQLTQAYTEFLECIFVHLKNKTFKKYTRLFEYKYILNG